MKWSTCLNIYKINKGTLARSIFKTGQVGQSNTFCLLNELYANPIFSYVHVMLETRTCVSNVSFSCSFTHCIVEDRVVKTPHDKVE